MATGQKTEFEIHAKDKTKKGLTSAQKGLNKTSKEADKLAGRFRNVARATVIMEGPLGGTAGRMSAMATMLNSVSIGTIAAGIGIAGMTAIALQSAKAFSSWEIQTAKINQLLTQTGNASGLTADEIEAMSLRIGRDTLSSADDVRAASGVLLTFKSVAGDSFKRTMVVASDLAAITGQDLKQSVIQLGKALEDPATGMSALRRSGISFTNSQKEMIVQMKKSGDVAGAQAEILKLLEGQLGGAGAAAGGGLAGAADLVAENWTDMLVKLGQSGAGAVATATMRELGGVIAWVSHLIKPDDVIRMVEIKSELREIDALIAKKEARGVATSALMPEKGALLREKRQIEDRMELKQKEVEQARAAGVEAQKEIQAQQLAEAEFDRQKKAAAEAVKEKKKDTGEAEKYGQKLIDDEMKLQTSLLSKGQMEDMYLEQRLEKIDENLANELISKEAAHAQEQAAYSLHNTRLTEITAEENQKQAEAAAKLKDMEMAATESALGDIAGLMSAQSSKLFKMGQGAAIANSLINTYQAVTKTMTSAPYPLNIPLAIAQGIAGMAQVQKIKQTKQSAKEFGGSVIGGRSYLVGERGPELLTAPFSGRVINNTTTSNLSGATNNINVTVVNDVGEQFVERNAVKIWDSILDRMNEEGLRFA